MQRMGKMNLTDAERDKLLTATRSRTARVADVRRAKLILMLEEGQSRDTIMQRLECDPRFISRSFTRFLSDPLTNIYPPPPLSPPGPSRFLTGRLAGMWARQRVPAPKRPRAKLGGAGAQLPAQAQAERWL